MPLEVVFKSSDGQQTDFSQAVLKCHIFRLTLVQRYEVSPVEGVQNLINC